MVVRLYASTPATSFQGYKSETAVGEDLVSTSYVERSNLTLRMQNRRMTRLTNAFSRKVTNHAHSIALHFFVYNFCRAHGTLTKKAEGVHTSPAMAAGLTDHVWKVEEVLALMDPNRVIC